MVGRTPNPPRAVRLPVPRSPGGHNTPGAVQGPGRGCATRRGGVTPYPPPRPGPWLLQCGGCGFARSTSQPRTAAVAAPRRPPPGRQRGAPPGRAAPLRSAPPRAAGPRVPACPTRRRLPGAQQRGPDAGTPRSPPSLLLAPRSAAWKCRSRPGLWGKGNREAAGATRVRAERVRLSASWVRPRVLALPQRDRGGRNRILCFWLSHFSFKGQTSAHIARSFKTRTPMVIAIAKHPRLALRCLDLISLGAVLEEESAGSRRLLLPPRLSAYAPVRGRHGKYFLH